MTMLASPLVRVRPGEAELARTPPSNGKGRRYLLDLVLGAVSSRLVQQGEIEQTHSNGVLSG